MASKELNTVEKKIINQIKQGNNFLLSGGAGSGKTYTLLEIVDKLFQDRNCKIGCITYTNNAADEIEERFKGNENNLVSKTYHDFLWGLIKNYNKNIKNSLISLIEKEEVSYNGDFQKEWLEGRKINYREWKNFEKGIISHNEVIKIANKLFKNYPLLRKILGNKFDFIFIDEYQDTQPEVIEIFLDYLESDNPPLIGLFGDSMQSIYNDGVGNIRDYVKKDKVVEIPKKDNFRSPKNIISSLNKIRNDDLVQEQAGERDHSIDTVRFFYGYDEDIDINKVKKEDVFSEFDFSDPEENKELYLTKRLIAKECGFPDLLEAYKSKYRRYGSEKLIGDDPDALANHLYKIQNVVSLYKNEQYNEFIKKTDFKIIKGIDKQKLKESINKLGKLTEKTIGEAINLADDKKIVLVEVDNFNENLFNKIKDISYRQAIKAANYRNEHSPYSTQHNVKGAEFENVFIVLDNGGWNNYNFEELFNKDNGKETVLKRTRKLFYVCCSRAKKRLIIYYNKPDKEVLKTAKDWFGKNNIIKI